MPSDATAKGQAALPVSGELQGLALTTEAERGVGRR